MAELKTEPTGKSVSEVPAVLIGRSVGKVRKRRRNHGTTRRARSRA